MEFGHVLGPGDERALASRIIVAASSRGTWEGRGVWADRHGGRLLEKKHGGDELTRISEAGKVHLTIEPFVPKSALNERKCLEGR